MLINMAFLFLSYNNPYKLLESHVFINLVILTPRVIKTATEPTMLTIVNATVESIIQISLPACLKGGFLTGTAI
jgi:hypothetical protein